MTLFFLSFKGPLKLHKNVKEGNITFEKPEEQQKEFKLELNEIANGSKKSENQKNTIYNIKTLYKSLEKDIFANKFGVNSMLECRVIIS